MFVYFQQDPKTMLWHHHAQFYSLFRPVARSAFGEAFGRKWTFSRTILEKVDFFALHQGCKTYRGSTGMFSREILKNMKIMHLETF